MSNVQGPVDSGKGSANPVDQVKRTIDAARRGPWVYFARDGGPGDAIKIGHTGGDPERRIAELNIGNPRPMSLLVAVPGRPSEEYRHHALFSAERIRGEWFAPSARLLAYVVECLGRPDAFLPTEEQSAESAAMQMALTTIEQQALEIHALNVETERLRAQVAHLSGAPDAAATVRHGPLAMMIADLERQAIEAALSEHGGNREKVAASLAISNTTLWRKMTALAIMPPAVKREAQPIQRPPSLPVPQSATTELHQSPWPPAFAGHPPRPLDGRALVRFRHRRRTS